MKKKEGHDVSGSSNFCDFIFLRSVFHSSPAQKKQSRNNIIYISVYDWYLCMIKHKEFINEIIWQHDVTFSLCENNLRERNVNWLNQLYERNVNSYRPFVNDGLTYVGRMQILRLITIKLFNRTRDGSLERSWDSDTPQPVIVIICHTLSVYRGFIYTWNFLSSLYSCLCSDL